MTATAILIKATPAIVEAAESTGCGSPKDWLLQVIAKELAERRALKVKALMPIVSGDESVPKSRVRKGRAKLDVIAIQKVLHLRNSMSIAELAQRFNVGESNIIRILRARDQGGTRTHAAIGHKPKPQSRAFCIKVPGA